MKALVLAGLVICVVVAGPVFVIINSKANSNESQKSYNSHNLNALTLESLLGSIAILIVMSVWVAFMYRNRPEIISNEEESYNFVFVENLDKAGDLESTHSSFEDNLSTHNNSQYCEEEFAAFRSNANSRQTSSRSLMSLL